MQQATEALAIGSPTQVGVRVDRPSGGFTEAILSPWRQDASQQPKQGHVVDRHAAGSVEDAVVRTREDRLVHIGKPRAAVLAVFLDKPLDAVLTRPHDVLAVRPEV